MEETELLKELNYLQCEDVLTGDNLQLNYENELQKREKNIQKIIRKDLDIGMTENNNIKNIYPYLNENGELQYRIVEQKEGERYVVQRLEYGEYLYGLDGIKKIPYNIPELKDNPERVKWIMNGEDKVDYLKKLGIIATTAPFNSPKKWRKEFNQYLLASSGVIIVDENKKKDENYVKNTYSIIHQDIKNVGIVNIIDLAKELGVNVYENDTIITLAERLNNPSKLKEILEEIEQQMVDY